jgi:hypothetical protein
MCLLQLNNYCAYCGKKLKVNKKGYSGKNRKFHKTCLDIIEYPTKEDFNYLTKANKKIENTEEMRNIEYTDYQKKRLWFLNKSFKY